MNHPARQWLKQFPSLVGLMRPAWKIVHSREIETCAKFPLFAPNSSGSPRARAELTVLAINQIFPFITHLLDIIGKNQLITRIVTAERFCSDRDSMDGAALLKYNLDKYGSDKASCSDYHLLYGPILKNRDSITAVLEIGIGTNNEGIVSNMGKGGKPGASLRAFRDFLPQARIVGADIDREILFSENRIETYFVDQTNLSSFQALAKNVGTDFDLIIDDGLHSPNANIAALIFAVDRLKVGGWFVVEDITSSALPVWQVIAGLLPAKYEAHIICSKGHAAFLIQRIKFN